jgi:hypothetical protein
MQTERTTVQNFELADDLEAKRNKRIKTHQALLEKCSLQANKRV